MQTTVVLKQIMMAKYLMIALNKIAKMMKEFKDKKQWHEEILF